MGHREVTLTIIYKFGFKLVAERLLGGNPLSNGNG